MKQTRKNIILLVLLGFAASGGGLRAQYYDYYYHRVGDTVEWKAPNGYYSWWELEYFYENNHKITIQERWAKDIGDSLHFIFYVDNNNFFL